jgi:alpha-glucosidase
MALGIAGVMNFNMFGIPMTGPNACGYYGATKEDELCGRWIQLASMFPLAKQHKAAGSAGGPDNQPYDLKAPYDKIAMNALHNRLQYIRQIYTCLFEANQEGGTCVDPLFYHYPEDPYTFDPTQTENSFILAGALKVVPVLNAIPAATSKPTIRTYFPIGDWVNMANYTDIRGNPLKGSWIEVPAPTEDENILTYLKPGSMTSFQPNDEY